MKEITVTTQAELDAVPADFDGLIIIRSPADPWLQLSRAWGSAHVVAWESAHVVAWGSAHVEARGSAHVVAWESAHVVAWDSAHVVAWESAHVVARDSAHVVARDSAHVVARDSAHVVAWESAHVVAWGSAHVVAWESAHVVAWGSAHVVAWESAHVEAWGSAHVEARGSAHVVARNHVTVQQSDYSVVELSGFSVCVARTPRYVTTQSTGALVRLFQEEPYLEREGVPADDGHVVLFKRVSSDWLTQENTENQTRWEPGTTVEHPRWDPGVDECGPGKFHGVSVPFFADEFRHEEGDRYVAIRVAIADLHEWPNPRYPHKVAFRRGVVLHECDWYGKEIT